MPDKPLIYTKHRTIKDAAAFLTANGIEISADTVRRMIDDRQLGYRRIRGKILIGEDQLEEYMQGVTICPEKKTTRKNDTGSENSGSNEKPEAQNGKSPTMTNERAKCAGKRRLRRILKKRKKSSTTTS